MLILHINFSKKQNATMADLIFTGELKTSKAGVKAYLELYSFVDDGVYIVYCPSLDLSGYGYSIDEAKNHFPRFSNNILHIVSIKIR